ncbi:MAG: hypothetical protein WBG36_07420 [Ornithinimicrobium sp.]
MFEIDADAIGATSTERAGLKAHAEPLLTTDMDEVALPFDASIPHTWTALSGNGETLISCEGVLLRRIAQSPNYPLFVMLDLLEIGAPSGAYPKTATVHRFQGWRDT